MREYLFYFGCYFFIIFTLIMPLYKQLGNIVILTIIALTSTYIISLITKKNNITVVNTVEIVKDTTWANIEISTWSTGTWVIIEPPTDPRLYLEYLIQYGSWWIDYIAKTPTNQPKMDSRYGNENTTEMHNYLYTNRINFHIPTQEKQWYVLFITSKSVSNISNIFLWVNGSTIWRLDKKKSLSVENKNEFLYKLNDISLIGNNNYHFSKDLSWKANIYINAVVWESDNKIEKIIIFFQ